MAHNSDEQFIYDTQSLWNDFIRYLSINVGQKVMLFITLWTLANWTDVVTFFFHLECVIHLIFWNYSYMNTAEEIPLYAYAAV